MQAEPPGGVTVEPDDHALGRSRGGLTTKLHLACEQGQKPLAVLLTAGQRGDSPQFIPILTAIRVPRLVTGRPRTRPDRVLADKGVHLESEPFLPAPARHRRDYPEQDQPGCPPTSQGGSRADAGSVSP